MCAVAFSADGQYLATASGDHTAGLWQLPHSNLIAFLPHDKEVVDVVFSPDGLYLATASSDHTACVWSTASGQQRFRLPFVALPLSRFPPLCLLPGHTPIQEAK